MRLDRLIASEATLGRRAVRERLAAGQARVNGEVERDGARLLDPFDRVEFFGAVLRARVARYVMLHKPAGVVSATEDAVHQTVLDLIGEPWARELHLAGRLDRFTTGLVILTNDSRFSEALTLPGRLVPKVYLAETDQPITGDAIAAFQGGMFFAKEKITTQPAGVELLGERRCRLTIYEGKHHQVKRMFARFAIKVARLHREAVGAIRLDLPEGHFRDLRPEERTL